MSALRTWIGSPSSRRLHVAKTLTWRTVATATTIVISYLVTGDLLIGATIGGIEATSKMALYYWHERAWARLVTRSFDGPTTGLANADGDTAVVAATHHAATPSAHSEAT